LSYLIDTNVLSELRKRNRCHPRVAAWFSSIDDDEIYISALVIGEIRKGIESVRRRDEVAAAALDLWLGQLASHHGHRILPVDRDIAETWGRLSVPDPLPVVDGLMAATALVHGLILVTRNVRDIQRTGVPYLDPLSKG